MKRLASPLYAAVIAACSTAPPATPARTYASEWLVTSGTGASINIHETSLGLAGRLVGKDGGAYPIRSIVKSEHQLSFIIPAINATYSATRTEEGWSGEWSDDNGKRTIVLTVGTAPDGAEKWIALTDGRQMFLNCIGAGSPTVIFESGAGGSSKDWAAVHDAIAKTTMACAYDRPGHGLSDPRPLPLDTATVVDDLDATLTAAKIAGPYVLVGHSLGSYHVRQFANTRFEKMGGMVLVDPSGDGQRARFNVVVPAYVVLQAKRSEDAKAAGCPQRLREKLVLRSDPQFAKCNGTNDPDLFEQTQSEIDSMEGASTDQLTRSRRSYGDMPLIVLTRSDYQKGMPPEITEEDLVGIQQVWETMHAEMAALSTRGEQRVIPDAGHFLQRDAPQAVIEAVNDVVAAVRERTR